MSRSTHAIQIGGSLCDSIIANIVQYDSPGEAITYDAGPEYVRGVTTTNIQAAGK